MKTCQGIMMIAGCLLSTAAMCASPDAGFARHAASGGLAEVSMGKLAESHAQSADVKSFGQRMVTDHSKANDQLMALAAQSHIKLPANPMPADQAAVDRLSKLQGTAFDRAYGKQMVIDHKKTIALFEHEASSGGDSTLKTFASDTLPTLKEHLQMARTLPGASGSSSSAGQ